MFPIPLLLNLRLSIPTTGPSVIATTKAPSPSIVTWTKL
jgi:hypothetical protein